MFTKDELATIKQIAEVAIQSGFYRYGVSIDGKTQYRDLKLSQAIAIIMTGEELGIGPMTALRYIKPFRDGAPPTISAHLEAALAQRLGYQIFEIEPSTPKRVRLGISKDGTTLGEYTYTIAQAEEEQKYLKNVWKTHPIEMLTKTAIVRLVRKHASQALIGAEAVQRQTDTDWTEDDLPDLPDDDTDYIPDEALEMVEVEDLEPEDEPVPPPKAKDVSRPPQARVEETGENPAPITDKTMGRIWASINLWFTNQDDFEDVDVARYAIAHELFPDLESFSDLTERQGHQLQQQFDILAIHAAGWAVYGEDWVEEQHERARHFTGGHYENIEDISATARYNLLKYLKNKLKAEQAKTEMGDDAPRRFGGE